MPKFRRKPGALIDAVQWYPNVVHVGVHEDRGRLLTDYYSPAPGSAMRDLPAYYVRTVQAQRAYLVPGDWILPEPDGIHYYTCKADIFANTYEPAEPPMMVSPPDLDAAIANEYLRTPGYIVGQPAAGSVEWVTGRPEMELPGQRRLKPEHIGEIDQPAYGYSACEFCGAHMKAPCTDEQWAQGCELLSGPPRGRGQVQATVDDLQREEAAREARRKTVRDWATLPSEDQLIAAAKELASECGPHCMPIDTSDIPETSEAWFAKTLVIGMPVDGSAKDQLDAAIDALDPAGIPISHREPIAAADPRHPARRASRFREELEQVINRHSRENGSDTPDFILAQFLIATLDAFDSATCRRERWYGRRAPCSASASAEDRIADLEAQLRAEGEHTAAGNAEIERLRGLLAKNESV